MTKIVIKKDRIIFDGHADTMQECETISLMCEQLRDSEAFKTIKYESGYAEFEKVGKTDDLKFTGNPGVGTITVNFDEHIASVTIIVEEQTLVYSTSGEGHDVSAFASDFAGTAEMNSGYVLDAIDGGTITGDNTFTFAYNGFGAELTLTSKISTPTYSFKHYYRNTSLIGTGTYKFRPYTVTEPVVTEDELAGTWVFNDYLDNTSLTRTYVDFTSNGITFASIERNYSTSPFTTNILNYYNSDGIDGIATNVCDLDSWTNEAYKTITITSKLSEVTDGNTLLTWLQANATKQGTSTEILINVSYANSSYNTLNIYDEENGILLETINEEGEYYITTTTGKIFISNEGPAPKYEITEAIGISNVYDETGTEISLSSLPVSSEYTTFLKFDYENESIISFIFNSDN